jgi:hypothetical protein
MNARVSGELERAGAAGRAVADWSRSHRFGLESTLMLALVLCAATASGVASVARAHGLHAERERHEALDGRLRGWEAAPRSPTPAERADWAASEREVERLARPGSEPLTLAKVVAERAREVGIAGVHIRLVERDSAGPVDRTDRDTWDVETGETALRVGFRGGMDQVVGLLGSLPPYVTVSELRVRPGEDGGPPSVEASLLARRVAAR